MKQKTRGALYPSETEFVVESLTVDWWTSGYFPLKIIVQQTVS